MEEREKIVFYTQGKFPQLSPGNHKPALFPSFEKPIILSPNLTFTLVLFGCFLSWRPSAVRKNAIPSGEWAGSRFRAGELNWCLEGCMSTNANRGSEIGA